MDRMDSSGVLSAHLDGVRVDVKHPSCNESLQKIRYAIGLIHQRAISEEDAESAISIFERVAALCPLGHLFLAEVYLTGASPQHGKDICRGLHALLSFLGGGGGWLRCREDTDRILSTIVKITDGMPANELAQHASSLICQARTRRALRIAALRASLAKLSILEGESCAALAPSEAVSPEEGAMDFLNDLFNELMTLSGERASLRFQVDEERAAQQHRIAEERKQRELLSAALQEKERYLLEFQALIHDKAATIDQLTRSNEELVARLEKRESLIAGLRGEMYRKQIECDAMWSARGALEEMSCRRPGHPCTSSYRAATDGDSPERRYEKGEIPGQIGSYGIERNDENVGPETGLYPGSYRLWSELEREKQANAVRIPGGRSTSRPSSGTAENEVFRSAGRRVLTPRRTFDGI